MQEIIIRQSEPGDAGYVAYMHGKYYSRHHGFHASAEYYFIKYLADFVHDPTGGQLWIAQAGDTIAGSVAIVRVDSKTAQFRWFLIDEGYQGKGIGKRLIQTALDFCRANRYEHVFLWTFKGLEPARVLYDRAGFVLTEEMENHDWSDHLIVEQRMDLRIPAS